MADPIQIVRSRQSLRRVRGGRDGLYPILENNTWDVVSWFDDFLGDEMRGSDAADGGYEVTTGVDGTFTMLADHPNGGARIIAGAATPANDEYCGVSLPELSFTGDRNAVMAVRVKLNVVTDVKMEIGFTDVTTDAGAALVLATPTVTASNCALWVMDTDDTANWQTLGAIADTVSAKNEPGTPPVAATYETMIVALRDTNAKYLRLNTAGELVYESSWIASSITAATALVPWIFLQARTGANYLMDIDFIDVRARRTT